MSEILAVGNHPDGDDLGFLTRRPSQSTTDLELPPVRAWLPRRRVAAAGQLLLDYVMEVDHQAQRIELLEGAIDRAVAEAPSELQAIVDAFQALRGVAKLTAVTLATEFGSFSRFERAAQVMSYTGLVPSEHSSGPKTRRSGITKTGNSHLRRVLVESGWHYRHRPRICQRQPELLKALGPKVAAIAWRAQERLHRRYWALTQKTKPTGKIVAALAREFVGFVWAIGTETEQQARTKKKAAWQGAR